MKSPKAVERRFKKQNELVGWAKNNLPENCPNCGNGKAVPAGLRIKCKKCGTILARYSDMEKKEKPKQKEKKGLVKNLKSFFGLVRQCKECGADLVPMKGTEALYMCPLCDT